MRPLESNAVRGFEHSYDRHADPFYGDAPPRGSGGWIDFLNGHFGGLHFGPGGQQGGFLANLGFEGFGPRAGTASSETARGDLASNFIVPDGSETEDAPGPSGDTVAGNTTSTEVLVIGAPAITRW